VKLTPIVFLSFSKILSFRIQKREEEDKVIKKYQRNFSRKLLTVKWNNFITILKKEQKSLKGKFF